MSVAVARLWPGRRPTDDAEHEPVSATEPATDDGGHEVAGENLMGQVRDLMHETNVRRIILKREDGSTILEIPMQTGFAVTLLAAVIAPVLVAVGAVAALVTKVTVVVERDDSDEEAPQVPEVPEA